MKIIICILCILSIFIFSAFAKRVIPSERVQNHVAVRISPNTSNTLICVLKKGESAKLLESIPYWYKVRCNNQLEGYVSKAWTDIVQEAVSIDQKNDLIIGSWNIKWFGYYQEDKHNYKEMADIVQTIDVLAIQELRGKRVKARLDSLLTELNRRGFKYDYVYSSETGYSNNPDTTKNNYLERFAFFWDIDRVQIRNPDQPYEYIITPELNNPVFRQVPITACFKVKSNNGFDFKIVTVHTVYSKDINHVRASELRFLHNWINEQASDLNTSEKDIFIIGDFNANPKNQPHHFNQIITDTTSYRIIFNEPISAGEPPLRTTILVKQDIVSNDHLEPVYDHSLISKHSNYAIHDYPLTRASRKIGVVEFDQEQKWQDIRDRKEVERAMSDHRPIWFRLDYDAEDRD